MPDLEAQLRHRAERGSPRGADTVWDAAVRQSGSRSRRRRVRVAVAATTALVLAGGAVALWPSERDDRGVVAVPAPTTELQESDRVAPSEVLDGAVVARTDGLFRIHDGDAVRLIDDGVRLGFALGDDRVVFQRPDPASGCPAPTSEPIEMLQGGERSQVAAVGEGEGATLTLLDAAFVDGRPLVAAVRGVGPCFPETSSERLVVIDVDSLEEADLGETGGWEYGVQQARVTEEGVVLLTAISIENEVELRRFDGTTAWTFDAAPDAQVALTVAGTELLVLGPSFGASSEPMLRAEHVDLGDGVRVRAVDLQLDPVPPLTIASGFCAHADARDGLLACDRTAGPPMIVDLESGTAEAIEPVDGGIVTLRRADHSSAAEQAREERRRRERESAERVDRANRAAALASMTGGPDQVLVGGVGGLRLLDAGTGDEIAVLDDLAHVARPARVFDIALGPDRTIWYTISPANDVAAVWRLSAEDPEPRRVVARGRAPAVSPDGQFLAYVAPDESSPPDDPRSLVVVRNLTDATEQRIGGLVAPSGDPPWAPVVGDLAWHPVGDRIAFSFSYGFEREENQTAILFLDEHHTLADAVSVPGNFHAPAYSDDGTLFVIEPYAPYVGRLPLAIVDEGLAAARDPRFAGLAIAEVEVVAGDHFIAVVDGGDVYILAPGGEPRLLTRGALAVDW